MVYATGGHVRLGSWAVFQRYSWEVSIADDVQAIWSDERLEGGWSEGIAVEVDFRFSS